MLNPRLEEGISVLVCDGRKALMLHNAGDSKYPKLECRESFEHADLASREMGSDAPGRFVNSATGRHSAVEGSDLHALAEDAFLRNVAAYVAREILTGRVKKIIIVAPARALGCLRQAMPPLVNSAIHAVLKKDYVNLPVYEIEKHITHAFSQDT